MTQEPRPIALFFDTETTGVPVKGAKTGDPRQPKLVQLAFILTDEQGKERSSCSVIVKPEGWKIPDDAAAVHGITTDMAHAYGIPLKAALAVFAHTLLRCDLLVAHNIQFDLKILSYAFDRIGMSGSMVTIDSVRKHCTMGASLEIMKLPPTPAMVRAGRGPYKSPRMSEAYKYFTGDELVGAHDALADVRGCVAVYDCLRKRAIGDA